MNRCSCSCIMWLIHLCEFECQSDTIIYFLQIALQIILLVLNHWAKHYFSLLKTYAKRCYVVRLSFSVHLNFIRMPSKCNRTYEFWKFSSWKHDRYVGRYESIRYSRNMILTRRWTSDDSITITFIVLQAWSVCVSLVGCAVNILPA